MRADQCVLSVKVDVDTFRGMEAGVPCLIRLFSRHGVRASFFIAMGPDNSGKAVLRFFTRRGFARKMLRSNAVGMYGFRTALSGTLLPARQIARSFPGHFGMLSAEGHEVGIHGWDHVRWHDRVPVMGPEEVRRDFDASCRLFEEITGAAPESSAAPGWACSPRQLAVQDESAMVYHSDCRGDRPFFPTMGGREFMHLQIPTTLPTLDELLGSGACGGPEELTSYYVERITSAQGSVLTVHAEAEGIGWADWFDRLLDKLKEQGVRFARLREIADKALASRNLIPRYELRMAEIAGRAGPVAIQS